MKKTNKKVHLVNLFKWRSIVAFIACFLTISLTLGSVVYGILTEPGETVKTEFEWFTVDSNCLTAFAALMILPYTVEGIRRKRLVYPKWMFIIHYAGTICISITFMFIMCFASWHDPVLAFKDENIFLHIFCPLAVLVSFFMVESGYRITRKDTLLGLIPFTIYAFLYFYNVVIAKNWVDHYQLNTFTSFYISMPVMFLLTYVIAMVIRFINNKLLVYREKQLRIIWDEQLDPVSIKIEIYSLGFHAGLKQDKEDVSIPFDILEEISNKFNIKLDELIDAYTKGMINGFKEKTSK